jgi:single-strand DNA-binding protein
MIDADFVQCTLWRKTAENTVHYCRKGSVVGITGRIQTRHYDNSEGRRVYVTEVVAESVQFLSRKQIEEEVPQLGKKPPEEEAPPIFATHQAQASAVEAIPNAPQQATEEPVPFARV